MGLECFGGQRGGPRPWAHHLLLPRRPPPSLIAPPNQLLPPPPHLAPASLNPHCHLTPPPAENLDLLRAGCCNLAKHIANARSWGVPVVVAINRFATDTEAELEVVRQAALAAGAHDAAVAQHHGQGGAGAVGLARAVMAACQQPADFRFTYPLDIPLKVGRWGRLRAGSGPTHRALGCCGRRSRVRAWLLAVAWPGRPPPPRTCTHTCTLHAMPAGQD